MKTRKTKSTKITKPLINSLPESPGVYTFWDKDKEALYIGKAINIKKRVASYFSTNLSRRTRTMIEEAKYLSKILVGSELEALLLEARLIKTNLPKYNTAHKDDKHPLYIKITKEKYPRVVTARKIEENPPAGLRNLDFYGPFPSSSNVRSVLRMLRRIFPYADHKVGRKGCLYSQIGQCRPCPSEIEQMKDSKAKRQLKSKYGQNIRLVRGVLSGKINTVRNQLDRTMLKLAKKEKFEEAAFVRTQIEKLDYITRPITPINHFLKNPNLIEDIRTEEIRQLRKLVSAHIAVPKLLRRIECFDVAHLTGTYPTASMVTFKNGEPDKSLYRHFRIKQKKGKSDIDSMDEVARRRVKYLSSWGTPDLIIVDGGKAQVGVFRKVFQEHKVPVVGLAKRFETLVIPVKRSDLSTHSFVERKVPNGPARNLVQRIRDEAHRFARRYHHKLLQKELLPSKK